MRRKELGKKLMAGVLAAGLAFGAMPAVSFAAPPAEKAADPGYHKSTATRYYGYDGANKISSWYEIAGQNSTTSPVKWAGKDSSGKANWYVLNSNTTIKSRIFVEDEVNLVLGDYTLSADAGITVPEGATLNIYSGSDHQKVGNVGTIKAKASEQSNDAAIGESISTEGDVLKETGTGTINVNGCRRITADGDGTAMGIGSSAVTESDGSLGTSAYMSVLNGTDENSVSVVATGAEENNDMRSSYMEVRAYTIPMALKQSADLDATVDTDRTAAPVGITSDNIRKITTTAPAGSTEVPKETVDFDTTANGVDIDALKLSADDCTKIYDVLNNKNNNVGLVTIRLSQGVMTVSPEVLSAALAQAKELKDNAFFCLEQKEDTDLTAAQQKVVNKYITKEIFTPDVKTTQASLENWGGTVSLSVKCDLTEAEAKKAVLYQIAQDGTLTKVNAAYADGAFTFEAARADDYFVSVGKKVSINKGFTVVQTKNKAQFTVKWNDGCGADGYKIYAAYQGKKMKKPVKTITDGRKTSFTLKKLDKKSIDRKKVITLYVQAYENTVSGEKILDKTETAYIAGDKNKKYTNAKKIKLQTSKVSLKKGKTAKISVDVVRQNKKKKFLPETIVPMLRYQSADTNIAKVNKNGKITAKKKGTCDIYVIAANGYGAKVKVTVK